MVCSSQWLQIVPDIFLILINQISTIAFSLPTVNLDFLTGDFFFLEDNEGYSSEKQYK